MKLKIYSVYDKKSMVYHPGQYCHNDGHAMRFFAMQFQNPDTVMGKYPEDFDIYRIGEFDDATGLLSSDQNVEFVVNVKALLDAERNRHGSSNSQEPA